MSFIKSTFSLRAPTLTQTNCHRVHFTYVRLYIRKQRVVTGVNADYRFQINKLVAHCYKGNIVADLTHALIGSPMIRSNSQNMVTITKRGTSRRVV